MQRFGGLSEEELGQKVLPDYVKEDLDILLVGVNPSYTSVHVGHHYAGAGNHIWPCIYESGLIPQQMTCYEDSHLLAYGIGLTNLCARPTRGATELTKKELKEGAEILLQKVKRYRPKIVAFNGKGIYESFSNSKNFYMGRQSSPMPGTTALVFVMPSSSARCSKLPRPHDKLPFFHALRKLRDWIRGRAPPPPDEEVVFTDYTQLRSLEPPLVDSSSRKRKAKGQENSLGSEVLDKQLVQRYPPTNMMAMGMPGFYPPRYYPSNGNHAAMMMNSMHQQGVPNKTMHMMAAYPSYAPGPPPPPHMFMTPNYHISSPLISQYGDANATRCWPAPMYSTPAPMLPPSMVPFPPQAQPTQQQFSNDPVLPGHHSSDSAPIHPHHPAMDYRPSAHPEPDPSSLTLLSSSNSSSSSTATHNQHSQCLNSTGNIQSTGAPCGSSTTSPENAFIDANPAKEKSESAYPQTYPSNYLPQTSQSSYFGYPAGDWSTTSGPTNESYMFSKLAPSSTHVASNRSGNDFYWDSVQSQMVHDQIPMVQGNYAPAPNWVSAAPSCSNATDVSHFNTGQQL